MQLRGVFPISCFKWKNPGEGFKFKKKTWGGFYPLEGFSNCYTGILYAHIMCLACGNCNFIFRYPFRISWCVDVLRAYPVNVLASSSIRLPTIMLLDITSEKSSSDKLRKSCG